MVKGLVNHVQAVHPWGFVVLPGATKQVYLLLLFELWIAMALYGFDNDTNLVLFVSNIYNHIDNSYHETSSSRPESEK